jgi:hypothetical protein
MRARFILLSLLLSSLALTVRAVCPGDTTGFICQTCIDGCDACSDATSCDTCSAQYYLDAGVCNACPEKCLVCASPYACDKCTPGYEKEVNSDGFEYCVFYWWKWFLIVFGSLLGLLLIGKCPLTQPSPSGGSATS